MADWEKCHTFAALILNFIITMKRNVFLKTVLLAVCTLFIAVGCRKDDSPSGVAAKMQGTWMLKTSNSKEVEDYLKKSFIEIKGNNFKEVVYDPKGNANVSTATFELFDNDNRFHLKLSNGTLDFTIIKIDDNVFEYKNSLKDTIMFEKFDFNLWNTRYKDFEKDPKYGDHYKLKDGSSFRPMYGGKGYIFYDVIPPLPAYYHYFYDYYENGNLKAYGKYAGMQVVKIGVWHYFDENGKETQVNEEAKLGKWTFNAILEVLHKDGVIDLYTGKNRDWNKLYIEFKNNNRKVAVIVFKERIDILIDTYYKYIFNCKTGKYTRKEYERYNENAKDMPTLPPLKNSKKNKRKRKKVDYLVKILCHKSSLILQIPIKDITNNPPAGASL